MIKNWLNSQFQTIQVVQEAAHLIQQQMKEEEREKSNAEEMDRQTDRHSDRQSDRDSNIDNDNLISVNSNSDSSNSPPIQLLLEEIAGDNNATFLW